MMQLQSHSSQTRTIACRGASTIPAVGGVRDRYAPAVSMRARATMALLWVPLPVAALAGCGEKTITSDQLASSLATAIPIQEAEYLTTTRQTLSQVTCGAVPTAALGAQATCTAIITSALSAEPRIEDYVVSFQDDAGTWSAQARLSGLTVTGKA